MKQGLETRFWNYFIWREILNINSIPSFHMFRKVDQKYLENFLNVVLKKDGEDQLDRLCEKWGSIT